MWTLIVLMMTTFLMCATTIQCAKKNEASKLKPKEISEEVKSANDQPKAAGGPKLKPRDADDNETINDAKSDWGAPPA